MRGQCKPVVSNAPRHRSSYSVETARSPSLDRELVLKEENGVIQAGPLQRGGDRPIILGGDAPTIHGKERKPAPRRGTRTQPPWVLRSARANVDVNGIVNSANVNTTAKLTVNPMQLPV